MISARELMKLVGKRGIVRIPHGSNTLKLTGRIEDVKQAYGNTRYVIAIDGQDARISVDKASFVLAASDSDTETLTY